MDQVHVMECSEEESVDECVRNEEWENEDHNQMDFEQESVDEIPEDAFNANTFSIMEKPNLELSELIHAYEIKKLQYEGILKNQVENIVDLQSACEKVSCTLEQLPILREQNLLRFNQVISEIHGIREKQCLLNELIEFTVQIYDDNMTSVYSEKERFAEQQRMNVERYTVFDMDVQEFPKIGNTIYNEIGKKIKKKREYCWLLNNYLADIAKSEFTSKELSMKIDIAFVDANDLNKQLLECESKLVLYKRTQVELNDEIQDEKTEFVKKMDEIVKREEECTEKLVALRQKVDEVNRELQPLLMNNVQLQNEVASAQKKLDTLENEKQEKASGRSTLEFHLEELTNQEKTLTESLSGLTRCKQMVVLVEDEVKSMEGEFTQQSVKSDQLNKRCNEFEKQIVEIESYTKEATSRTNALEKEYAKISPDVTSLKNTLHKGRTELDNLEEKTLDEIKRVQFEIDLMNQKSNEYRRTFEEYQTKFDVLNHHKEAQRAIIKEKYSLITQKDECMHSIYEELEECQVEFSDLNEQKKNASELKNQVNQLENDLSEGREALALVNENSNKNFSKLNEMNNRQIEEAVEEMESRKQEYLSALEEKTKETSVLEEEFKLLQTTAATSSNMLKDATKQAELFTCEQSLLSTFAKWVFDERSPSVPTTEPWVTSTSDNNVTTAGSVNESESNFEVREIKTVRRTEELTNAWQRQSH